MPPIQLYLHTYSLRFHLAHQPGFDVFAFRVLPIAQAIGAKNLRTYTRYKLPPTQLVTQTIADLRTIAPLAAK